MLNFGVPPNFFTKLVCPKVKKVENHWSKDYILRNVSLGGFKTKNIEKTRFKKIA